MAVQEDCRFDSWGLFCVKAACLYEFLPKDMRIRLLIGVNVSADNYLSLC